MHDKVWGCSNKRVKQSLFYELNDTGGGDSVNFTGLVTAYSNKAYRCTGSFFARGGGEPFAQKILASCPDFYETVEKKRRYCDALT